MSLERELEGVYVIRKAYGGTAIVYDSADRLGAEFDVRNGSAPVMLSEERLSEVERMLREAKPAYSVKRLSQGSEVVSAREGLRCLKAYKERYETLGRLMASQLRISKRPR